MFATVPSTLQQRRNPAGSDPPRSAFDVDELRAALGEANIPTLLLALTELTGDQRWLEPPFRPTRGKGLGDHDTAGLSEDVLRRVRDEALSVLVAWSEGRLAPAQAPPPEQIAHLLGMSMGQDVPATYGPLLSEELGLVSRDVEIPPDARAADFRVLIIGFGVSGLCAAIKLGAAGVPYTIIEKNDDVGGTWYENAYPGCGVDTPSHLYSFSFAQQPAWSSYFAKRPEIHRYLESLADEYGIRDNVEFGSEVLAARWKDDEARWSVTVRNELDEERLLSANVLISAVGLLNRPSIPLIPGLDSFSGPVMHTAQWQQDTDLHGKRVAVIGTGASAMQLVPSIAGIASHVTVFQRSPQWAIPHPNYKRSVTPAVRFLMTEVPFYGAWYRARLVWNFGDRLHPTFRIDPEWSDPDRSINEANDGHRRFLTGYIHSELADRPDLIEKSVPSYPPYGKRPLIDNGWFSTIKRHDVELVTEPVTSAREDRVVTSSGGEYPADVVVLATGFQTLRILGPMEITGRSGRTLRQIWGEDDARAYLGMSIPDFPNFFCLFGPNSSSGHGGSAILTTELQVRYITALVGHMLADDIDSVEPRADVHDAYNEILDAELSQTIWTHPGMTTYYRNGAGRVVTNTPWTNVHYRSLVLEPNLDDFVLKYRNGTRVTANTE